MSGLTYSELLRLSESGKRGPDLLGPPSQPQLFRNTDFPQLQHSFANFVKSSAMGGDSGAEFRIQNEDFPALPGAQAEGGAAKASAALSPAPDPVLAASAAQADPSQPKSGIQTSPDGRVSGIPAGMLCDQFGMAGLLTFLRAIETEPVIVALALGHDLTTLGLNLNAPEKNLYASFGGPWAEAAVRPADVDFHVPEEYLTNVWVREKLPPIKLNRFQDDLLFYLFYNFPGDFLQTAAAAELYARDWRYHKEERLWLTRAAHSAPIEQTGSYERGTYNVFEPSHWRKVLKEMVLEYSKLEERPPLGQAAGATATPSNPHLTTPNGEVSGLGAPSSSLS